MSTTADPAHDKAGWRHRILARRSAMSSEMRSSEAKSLVAAVTALPMVECGATVCGYLPFGSEPGSLDMIEALRAAGARVLLPVVPHAPGPLQWAVFHGARSLVAGRLRAIQEPTGSRFPPTVLQEASLVLVPALAVDRVGVRLGRGAGYYDRSLPLAAPTAALVAVVRDDEFVPRLPADAHDVRMTGVLTPHGGLTVLRSNLCSEH